MDCRKFHAGLHWVFILDISLDSKKAQSLPHPSRIRLPCLSSKSKRRKKYACSERVDPEIPFICFCWRGVWPPFTRWNSRYLREISMFHRKALIKRARKRYEVGYDKGHASRQHYYCFQASNEYHPIIDTMRYTGVVCQDTFGIPAAFIQNPENLR